MPFPLLDPVALHLGPIDIRWYSLAYVAGVLLGWWLVIALHQREPIPNLTVKARDDMMMWAIFGIIFGGRLGYVLFYNLEYFLASPMEIFAVWHGGMSFHGGLIGFILAFWLFSRRHHVRFLHIMDLTAVAAPIGIFFGRLANFVNGELYGCVTQVSWGVVFPRGGELPRHPSQLYEAGLEGIVLFVLLLALVRFAQARRYPGLLSGVFLSFYALARIFVEQFREPDMQLGYFLGHYTMGQFLSLPMLAIGAFLVLRAVRAPH